MNTNDKTVLNRQELSVKELYFLLLKHIKIIVLSIVICFSVCLIYIFTIHPTYQSQGSILIEDPSNDTSQIFDIGLGKTKNFIENETEILKSRTTSEQVIKYLMNSNQKLHILRNNNVNNTFWNFSKYDTNISDMSSDSSITLFSLDVISLAPQDLFFKAFTISLLN